MAVLPCGNKYSVYQIMTMQIPQQTKKENKSDPEVLEGACAATIFTHREAMNWRAKKSITILICCLGLFSQACNVDASRITCYVGQTIKLLFERRTSRESLDDFSGYRVYKNDSMFGSLGKNSSAVYRCSDFYSDLEEFCLTKTEFVELNETYMMLKIKNITLEDSGNYSMHFLFNSNFESHAPRAIHLEVIEGKSPMTMEPQDKKLKTGTPTKDDVVTGPSPRSKSDKVAPVASGTVHIIASMLSLFLCCLLLLF